MSTPTTHDPRFVNTRDGVCWERRAVTDSGLGLYAVEGSCKCPPFKMATFVELAAHGIVEWADVLPMPVGPQPQPLSVDADRAKAPWGRGEDGRPLLGPGAHWTDVPEVVDQELARIQGRVDQAQSGHWYVASDTEAWRPAGTVRTNVDGYQRTVGQVTNMRPADLELVLHAHDDLGWCLDMIAKLRAQVAELNESVTSAAETLRARQGVGCSCPPADHPHQVGCPLDLPAPGSSERPVNELTAAFTPMPVLREVLDGEHYAYVHHEHRTPHDLPELGGA